MARRILRKLPIPTVALCCTVISFLIYALIFTNLLGKEDAVSSELSTFEGFDNVTGADKFIVPNIIHYIRFNKKEFSFIDYICLLSAYVNHRPDYFYFHTNSPSFTGYYWNKLQQNGDLSSRFRFIPTEPPKEIYGQPLNPEWLYFHGSDVTRIRLMRTYGGIFLDNDAFVVKNLDKYRKFEIAINWDEDQFLGCQIIIANKDARFLKLWLESYRQYNASLWYYNAGEKPTKEILYEKPHLIHRVKWLFGVDIGIGLSLYNSFSVQWRTFDTIHLLINHRYYRDPLYSQMPEINEDNVKGYNCTFGEMARDVLDLYSNYSNDK